MPSNDTRRSSIICYLLFILKNNEMHLKLNSLKIIKFLDDTGLEEQPLSGTERKYIALILLPIAVLLKDSLVFFQLFELT